MKKILLSIASIILVGIFAANMMKSSPTEEESTLPEYMVETVLASDLTHETVLEKSTLVKAGSQVTLSAQSGGRVSALYVKPGQKVLAGQVLVELEDVFGMSYSARDEAAIALDSSRITRESTALSLNQAVVSAKSAYDRAQKSYNESLLENPLSGPSKTQLEYENYIIAQEKTLAGFELTYQSQLQSFQSFLANVIDTTDNILGVSYEKSHLNDSYEFLLGALDTTQKRTTEQSVSDLLNYKNWTPDPTLPLIDRVQEMQRVYNVVNTVLTNMETLLINSVTDATNLTPSMLATFRGTIDGYQSQYSGVSTGLVGYLNTAQTFLATYEKEREAREKALETATDNLKDALDLARDAYETAQKTQEITLRQMDQTIAAAQLRLRNTERNIGKLVVTAPVSGIVGTISVVEGQEVNIGTPVVEVASHDAEGEITVDSATLEHIDVGMDVSVNYRGETLPGKIATITPIADKGLNFSVKIAINAPISVFGDFATVDIPMSSVFPTIPITAVNILAPGQGQISLLKTQEDGTLSVEVKNVILGSLWHDRIEITSALNPTDEIIITDMKNYNNQDFTLKKK